MDAEFKHPVVFVAGNLFFIYYFKKMFVFSEYRCVFSYFQPSSFP